MRQKILNPKTGQYEWVNMGPASSGNGTCDFHRHTRIVEMRKETIAKSCERIEEKFSKMSNYKKEKYIRTSNRKFYGVDDLRTLKKREKI